MISLKGPIALLFPGQGVQKPGMGRNLHDRYPAARRVWRGETEVEVSTKGFALLEILMRRPGAVVSRFELLEGAWDNEYEHRSNVIDVHIRQLRERVDQPFGVRSIETVRGVGYRLRKDGGQS